MTLDSRGRRAARSLQASLAGLSDPGEIALLAARRRRNRLYGALAFGLAATVLALAAVLATDGTGVDVALTAPPDSTLARSPEAGAIGSETTTADAPGSWHRFGDSGDGGDTRPVPAGNPAAGRNGVEDPIDEAGGLPPDEGNPSGAPAEMKEPWAAQSFGCSTESPPAEVFHGYGTPGDTITVASPYGTAEAVVDDGGRWEATVTFESAPLDEPFAIVVGDGSGERREFSFTVADPEGGSCPGDIGAMFWAAQSWGCSAQDSPVEVFYGAGLPGDTVTVTSPYGSAAVLVDATGWWEVTVGFTGAPRGEPFTIGVAAGTDEVWEFSFTVAEAAAGCPTVVETAFWAGQTFGCSAEQPPVEAFFGGGVPGDTITLTSPFGGTVVMVDQTGWWEATIAFAGAPLDEAFLVAATNGAGEVWELAFAAADPESGTCPGPVEPPWAWQLYGCSAEEPPFEVFQGYGEPGDTITLASDYGAATTTVTDEGTWEATLTFAAAPGDIAFVVWVSDGAGRRLEFSFGAVGPDGSCGVVVPTVG